MGRTTHSSGVYNSWTRKDLSFPEYSGTRRESRRPFRIAPGPGRSLCSKSSRPEGPHVGFDPRALLEGGGMSRADGERLLEAGGCSLEQRAGLTRAPAGAGQAGEASLRPGELNQVADGRLALGPGHERLEDLAGGPEIGHRLVAA